MAALLRDEKVMDYAIIAIQEPWVCSLADTTHFPSKFGSHYDLIWPTVSRPAVPRVCTFVKKNLPWTLVFYGKDIISIHLEVGSSGQPGLFIHNIYNAPAKLENSGVQDLRQALEATKQFGSDRLDHKHVIVGDFNIHDPLWSGNGPLQIKKEREDDSGSPDTNNKDIPDTINPYNQIGSNAARAKQLKMLLEEIPLAVITPPGIKTHPATPGIGGTGSTIDLCMTS